MQLAPAPAAIPAAQASVALLAATLPRPACGPRQTTRQTGNWLPGDVPPAMAGLARTTAAAVVIAADSEPLWRALQQLVLIVGPLLLRPLVEQQLGGPLFEPANFERWMRANADLLKHGLYTPPTPSTPAPTTSPPEPGHTPNPQRRPRER